MKSNAMTAHSKFLILLAIFLSASNADAFTSLSPVAGHQVRVNYSIRFQQPMSDPTNEPSREPIREPTNDQKKRNISPQFHVIFDDDFTTVPYLRTAAIPPY